MSTGPSLRPGPGRRRAPAAAALRAAGHRGQAVVADDDVGGVQPPLDRGQPRGVAGAERAPGILAAGEERQRAAVGRRRGDGGADLAAARPRSPGRGRRRPAARRGRRPRKGSGTAPKTAGVSGSRASAPPRWRSCTKLRGVPESGPARATRRSSVASSTSERSVASSCAGRGIGGSWASVPSSSMPVGRSSSASTGATSSSGATTSRPYALVAEDRDADAHDAPAAQLGRHRRERRDVHDRRHRRDLLADGVDPAPPGGQHVARVLARPGQQAAEDGRGAVQPDLERGDDREAAAAAPQRPEGLGVAVGGDARAAAVPVDDLGGEDRAGARPEGAGERADAAAEAVAGDADVGRAPARRRAARAGR